MIFDFTEPDSKLRVLGIDPGTNRCGISYIELCLKTGHITVVKSLTHKGTEVTRLFPKRFTEVHGERIHRNMGYGYRLFEIACEHLPHIIFSESPFAGKFVQAFGALTEQVTMLRLAAIQYSCVVPFEFYAPTEVKKHMKVNGKSSDKEAMRKALGNREGVHFANGLNIDDLDEHEVDSICVAITGCDNLLKQLRN